MDLFDVVVNDSAGNSKEFSFTVIYDTTRPTVSITVPGPGAWYNTTALNVTWSGSDPISGIAYYLVYENGEQIANVTTNYTEVSGLIVGSNTIEVVAYDNAGNMNESTKTFNVEMASPSVSISSPSKDALLDSTSVQVTWTGSSASGISHYWIDVNGAGWVAENLNTSFSMTAVQGLNTVSLKAEDHAGNWNTTTVSFDVDSIAPTISIVSPTSMYNNTGSVTVSWTASDSGSGLAYYDVDVFNGKAWTNYTDMSATSKVLSSLTDGSYTVYVEAFDNAGNMNSASVSFIVDTVAPTIVSISPSGNDVGIESKVTLTFSEAMNEGSVSIVVNGVSGTMSWSGNTATFTPSSSLVYNTRYSVSVSGKDLAGNAMSSSWSFTTETAGTITGTATDSNGNPIANATVTLSNGMTTTTDANGAFVFDNVTAGSYNVTISKSGYQTMTEQVNSTAAGTSDLGSISVSSVAGSNDDALIAVGVIVIVAVLIGAFLLIRHRKK